MHDLRLIHTDLKPENILLVSSEYIQVPDYKVFLHFSIPYDAIWSWCALLGIAYFIVYVLLS